MGNYIIVDKTTGGAISFHKSKAVAKAFAKTYDNVIVMSLKDYIEGQ